MLVLDHVDGPDISDDTGRVVGLGREVDAVPVQDPVLAQAFVEPFGFNLRDVPCMTSWRGPRILGTAMASAPPPFRPAQRAHSRWPFPRRLAAGHDEVEDRQVEDRQVAA